MKDISRRTPGNRKPNRRQVLGLAATATGSAAAVWLFRDRTRTRQTEADPTAPAAQTPGTSGPPASASAATQEALTTALVRDDGFDIRVGSVRVFAPGGVAAPGTQISVSTPAAPIPGEFRAFSSAVGQPVRVVLGDGQQPQKPVTVVFDLRGTELGSNVSDEAPLTVIARSESSATLTPMESTWDALEETLTIVTDRLMREPDEASGAMVRTFRARPATTVGRSSGRLMGAVTNGLPGFDITDFWPIRFDLRKFVTDTMTGLLGLHFTKPACAYEPLSMGSKTFTISRPGDDVMWPCLRGVANQFVIDLHSNSIIPWAVKTNPFTSGSVSGDFVDLGPGLAAIYEAVFAVMGDQRSVVMPGNTTSFRYDAANPPVRVEARQAPGLFVFTATLQMVTSIFDSLGMGRIVEVVIDSLGAFDCVSQIINTTYQEYSSEISRGVVMSTLSCMRELLDDATMIGSRLRFGPAIVIVGLCLSGAGLIIGAVEGAIREVTGKEFAAFAISHSVTAPEDGKKYDFVISAMHCDGLPVTSATSCEPAVGVQFTVTTASGEWLGDCTTLEPSGTDAIHGVCSVKVPFGTTVIVREDVSTIPAGYAPLENPISVETPSELVDGVSLDVVFWNGPERASQNPVTLG